MDHDPKTERGVVTWHSSDEDSGPDVGLMIGLGEGRVLYVGEISKDMADRSGAADDFGWHLVIYPTAESFAKFHDVGKAREFFDVIEGIIGLVWKPLAAPSLASPDDPTPTGLSGVRPELTQPTPPMPPGGSCEPPAELAQYMAHYLKIGDGTLVSAVWLRFDKVWLIHGAFMSAKLAADCGYTYAGRYEEGP